MTISNRSIAIVVIHFSKLKDRKLYLAESLSRCNLPVFWVTEKQVQLSDSLFTHEYNAFGVNRRLIAMDRSNNSRSLIKPRLLARLEGIFLLTASLILPKGMLYLTDNPSPSRESHSMLELTKMHVEGLKVVFRLGFEWALFIEDDAIIDWVILDRVIDDLDKWISRKPIWLNLSSGAGLGHTKFDSAPDELGLFRVRPWATRCASGYMVNRLFISKSLDLLEKFGIPDWTAIDVVYQIIMRKIRAKVFWQEPSSIKQGSETGHYKSNWGH